MLAGMIPRRKISRLVAPALAAMLLVLVFAVPSGAWAEEDPFAYEEGQPLQILEEAKGYPENFDLRNVDGKSYVTPVKLQNPFGTCWGFAAISAAESAILADETLGVGVDSETLDLSEKHLIYFVGTPLNAPGHPQNGEGRQFSKEVKTASDLYDTGGLATYATSVFSSGVGPAPEVAFPYQGLRGEVLQKRVATAYDEKGNPTKREFKDVWYSDEDDWNLSQDDRFYSEYRLQESYLLPSPARRDGGEYTYDPAGVAAIKDQMYNNHRAVAISFRAESFLPGQDTSGKKYMSKNWAHYTWEIGNSNHAVTIVGWDDNYPKENFLEGHQPPEDGAFLIKNSWGSELNEFPTNGFRHWGLLQGMDGIPYDPEAKAKSDRATGYFWLSYYDHSLRNLEAFNFDQETGDNGYYVEQHDYVVTNDYRNVEAEGSRMANVFTAEATSELSGISAVTTTPGTEVSYEIYLLRDDYTGPEDGVLIAGGETSFQYGGFHRIQLPQSQRAILSKGQKYSVIFTHKTPSGQSYVTLPLGIAQGGRYEASLGYYDNAVINPGESYWYLDEWMDLSDKDLQETLKSDHPDDAIDNFPIKSYLEPVVIGDQVFDGYLTISNLSRKQKYSFELKPGESFTLSADFKGLRTGSPAVDTEVRWSLSDSRPCTMDVREDGITADFTGLQKGVAYLLVDAGRYGMRLIGVPVVKPTVTGQLEADQVITYTGKDLRPAVSCQASDGGTLEEGRDYTLTYKKNRKCGRASVVVTGIGSYEGGETLNFTIAPARAKIRSLKSAGKSSGGKVTVRLKNQKKSGLTGYQIQYRIKGTKAWKTKTMRASKTVMILKGLKKGKKYQVRACGYVKTQDGTFCGSWSKPGTVKVKARP